MEIGGSIIRAGKDGLSSRKEENGRDSHHNMQRALLALTQSS